MRLSEVSEGSLLGVTLRVHYCQRAPVCRRARSASHLLSAGLLAPRGGGGVDGALSPLPRREHGFPPPPFCSSSPPSLHARSSRVTLEMPVGLCVLSFSLKICRKSSGAFKRFHKVACRSPSPSGTLGYYKRKALIEQSSLEENPHFNGQRAGGEGGL